MGLGKRFAPLPKKRSTWISAEYLELSVGNRREVVRMIRMLLRHQTLRVTPALEAGVSDHVWSIGEIVGLLG